GAGLLGLVLAWLLLVYLPSRDVLQEKLVKSFRDELAAERVIHEREIAAVREETERRHQENLGRHAELMTSLLARQQELLATLQVNRHAIKNVAQHLAINTALTR